MLLRHGCSDTRKPLWRSPVHHSSGPPFLAAQHLRGWWPNQALGIPVFNFRHRVLGDFGKCYHGLASTHWYPKPQSTVQKETNDET